MPSLGAVVEVKRGPIKRKTALRPVSAKRRAHMASKVGQDGLAYMMAVKRLPCAVCCYPPPSDAHHCIHDRFGTRKTSDFDVIPLCKAHHQDGPDAIHNGKETWRQKYGADYDYIERVRRMLDAL